MRKRVHTKAWWGGDVLSTNHRLTFPNPLNYPRTNFLVPSYSDWPAPAIQSEKFNCEKISGPRSTQAKCRVRHVFLVGP